MLRLLWVLPALRSVTAKECPRFSVSSDFSTNSQIKSAVCLLPGCLHHVFNLAGLVQPPESSSNFCCSFMLIVGEAGTSPSDKSMPTLGWLWQCPLTISCLLMSLENSIKSLLGLWLVSLSLGFDHVRFHMLSVCPRVPK